MRQSGRRLARPAGQDYRTAPTELSRGENAACAPRVPNGRPLGGVAQAAWLDVPSGAFADRVSAALRDGENGGKAAHDLRTKPA
jgi:hypothetical protein